MLTYRPDKFEKIYHTADGAALWAFLHQPDILLRMETATYPTARRSNPCLPPCWHGSAP